METIGGKVQNVTGRGNRFFAFDKETDSATDDYGHLFVRVGVFRRHQERNELKTHDHDPFADNHLAFDTFSWMFDRNVSPVQTLSHAGDCSRRLTGFRSAQRHDDLYRVQGARPYHKLNT